MRTANPTRPTRATSNSSATSTTTAIACPSRTRCSSTASRSSPATRSTPRFRELAGPEIEQFKREKAAREGAGATAEAISDAELLREVMNTVGKAGRLGEGIRCVVSVSMLTEGWDTNTVTHIVGVRAFGTQLLCEQVVGRALRRQSYELDPKTQLFPVEYADILGIPFAFTAKPVAAPIVRAKAGLPRPGGQGARRARNRLPPRRGLSRRSARRAPSGPVLRRLAPHSDAGERRPLHCAVAGHRRRERRDHAEGAGRDTAEHDHLPFAKRLIETRFRDAGEDLPVSLFGDAQRIVRRWIDEGYLVAKGVPLAAVTYLELADMAAERIYLACQRVAGWRAPRQGDPRPLQSQRLVASSSISPPRRPVRMSDPRSRRSTPSSATAPGKAELARVIERNPHVLAYVKNQGLNFEVPYRDGATARRYLPDFIVRIDDGGDEPLNLILETKGYRGGDAQLKAETMKALWVPGVNNLGTQGRWAFVEFTDPFDIQAAFDKLVDDARAANPAKENA